MISKLVTLSVRQVVLGLEFEKRNASRPPPVILMGQKSIFGLALEGLPSGRTYLPIGVGPVFGQCGSSMLHEFWGVNIVQIQHVSSNLL